MQRKNLAIVLVSTFFAFSTLYLPQPLLPLIAKTFSVSAADATLLVSVTMLPLGIVPIFFGFFLQSISARSMLRHATLLLAISSLLFLFAEEFWQLLVLRALQGLLLPAIFTALMTYCSSIAPNGKIRQYIAYYIATTILGGFFGRTFSGAIATWYDWRYSFGLLGTLLLFGWFLQQQLDSDTKPTYSRADPKTIINAWRQPVIRNALLTIFTFFFTFSALLSALPFRMVELAPAISEFEISSVYFGYLIGIVVAINAEKISSALGGQSVALTKTIAIYFSALLLFCIPNTHWMMGFMLIASACFFLLHATLSGFVNHIANNTSSDASSTVNGLYVSFYYAGGSLGAWLPAFIYRDFGWNWFIASICGVLFLSFLYSRRLSS